ncbi:MAG: EamA family transporter [Burkholderiaceae bacterium]
MPTPLLFLCTVFIWGSTFLVITFQLGEVAPAVSVVLRFGIGAFILFGWCLARGDRLLIGWRRQPWLVIQGMLNFGLSYVCTYQAEAYLVSALVAVLFALMVFWNAVGAHFFFGTALTGRILCAALLSICGVALLFWSSLVQTWQAIDAPAGNNGRVVLLGLTLAVISTLSASAGNMVAARVGRQPGSNVFVTTGWAMFYGMVSVALWAIMTGRSWQVPSQPIYWISMFYLSLCGSVFAFTAYFTLINRIGPGKAAYTGVLTPVVSVLLSMRFEGYRPGTFGFLGMALCLIGVFWAIRGNTRYVAARTAPLSAEFSPATGDHT